MTTIFKRNELPIAYTMIETARRIRPRRDGSQLYQQYFLFWTAFNNIYTTIAHRKGCKTRLVRDADNEVVTVANGNVRIPQVVRASAREQIQLALEEFGDDLKRALVLHPGTAYFAGRTLFWGGKEIETDALGQRLNGVIDVSDTTDARYPIWSPIDHEIFHDCQENQAHNENRDFLVSQIVDLLYTIRRNFMHAGRTFDDAHDISVVEHALPMLELIVKSFIR